MSNSEQERPGGDEPRSTSDHAGTPDYLAPYRDAVDEHGAGFSATLWGSEETQRLRFDVIDALLPLEGCRILDVGCGQGDLVAHLLERDIRYGSYVGIDAMVEMVDAGTAREFRDAAFVAADLLADPGAIARAEPDVVVISGALNTMDESVARSLVARCLDAAAQGVAFNFLGDRPHARWDGRDLTPARRFSTLDWLDWATARSSRVRFDQSYLDGHDVTIAILHDGDSGSGDD